MDQRFAGLLEFLFGLPALGQVAGDLGKADQRPGLVADRVDDDIRPKVRADYAADLEGSADIEERLDRLVARRTREGYMAEWRVADDGAGWLLVENHCPICAAAAICQGFCRAELDIFRAILGPDVTVDRVEHALAGASRCAYRIEPAAATA